MSTRNTFDKSTAFRNGTPIAQEERLGLFDEEKQIYNGTLLLTSIFEQAISERRQGTTSTTNVPQKWNAFLMAFPVFLPASTTAFSAFFPVSSTACVTIVVSS